MADAAVSGTRTTQRVLVAADKFKGSLTAVEVAERVTAGLRRAVPHLEVAALPVA
ncbi:glycerate kinase, partial [Streptomyces sp. NPDC056948]|uniref:glycerate kinase n=1 Tax=Streptomyces sp. NPDC056948 TaxID=3345975 RepID=UPI003640061F